MKTNKITISSQIGAPARKVWNLYTDPQHIVGWNFASEEWHCPKAENDLRKGGKYLARMEAKDGSFGFDFEAIYDDVREPQSISYHLDDGRNVTTTFEEQDGSTVVTTIFDAEDQNPTDMQRDGWQAILNNFKKYVESN